MSDQIHLVQGDTLPTLYVQLIDQHTGGPVDVSEATEIAMTFYVAGGLEPIDVLIGTTIAGAVNPDGSINTSYTVPGSGGRFTFNWNEGTLAGVGRFSGSISVTWPGGLTQSAYATLRFFVRAAV